MWRKMLLCGCCGTRKRCLRRGGWGGELNIIGELERNTEIFYPIMQRDLTIHFNNMDWHLLQASQRGMGIRVGDFIKMCDWLLKMGFQV